MFNIEILCALPGGGKTTYAFEQLKLNPKTFIVKDEWSIHDSWIWQSKLRDAIRYNDHELIIVDGLWLTKQKQKDVISVIKNALFDHTQSSIKFVCWEPDVEACLHNDLGRRSISSSTTIKRSKVHIPSSEDKYGMPFSVVMRKTIKSSEDKRDFLKSIGSDSDYIRSEEWCLGGSTGNCWNNRKVHYDSEPQKEFEELDKVLEIVWPDISYLEYKKLNKSIVSIEERYEHDYYAAGVTYAYWQVSLDDLYSYIKENKVKD